MEHELSSPLGVEWTDQGGNRARVRDWLDMTQLACIEVESEPEHAQKVR